MIATSTTSKQGKALLNSLCKTIPLDFNNEANGLWLSTRLDTSRAEYTTFVCKYNNYMLLWDKTS